MKHLKRIDEAVGTINERRASAESLLKAVVNGDAKDVEGITLSKAMADAYLAWLQQSTYGKKFSALPFYKLFDASFNWGIERYIDSKLKGELKELKAQAKSMKEGKELNEGKMWNDIAKIMDKALKQADVPLSYARDYVKSLERMAKKNSKKFFDEYGNFSEDDFIEDVEYNLANESVTEGNKYSVEYSDGIRGSKEFRNESDAIKHAKELSKDKSIQFVSVHKPGMHSTASKEDLIAWYGKGSYWDNVSKKDKEVAELQLENLAVTEAAPKMKKNEDAIYLQELMNKVANAQKGGSGSRYGKEFDKSKTKALRAIKDMVMYSTIGI